MIPHRIVQLAGCALCLIASGFAAADALSNYQVRWAQALYEEPQDNRAQALSQLAEEIRTAANVNPNDAELLTWKGIIVSTLAGEKGGLGALSLAKEAKAALERAIEIDASALNGSALTSLGTLYHQVPGWPIGFGNDKKAKRFLERGLAEDPNGIDSNYFMGLYLLGNKQKASAEKYLLTALQAKDRPHRALADAGRREDIRALVSTLAH